jgi:hypothetical protein
MYAALIRASQTWKRVVISQFELKQIDELHAELDAEFRQRTEAIKTNASQNQISSRKRT